jgi:thymidylate kinase
MTSRALLASKLFAFLESEGVLYVVVGDTREFPDNISSDIDIVVEPNTLPRIPEILLRFCTTHNARLVQGIKHEQTSWYFVCALTDDNGNFQFIHPDICGDYFRNGQLMLSADEILSERGRSNNSANKTIGFYIPSPAQGFIYYLLKKVDKGYLDPCQGEFLSLEWGKNPEGAKAQLKRFWPEQDIKLLANAAEGNKWEEVIRNLPDLRKVLRSSLRFSWTHYRLELDRIYCRIINPTGLHVAFLGPDGSGKSTILAKVEKNLAPAFRLTKRYHLRPFFGRPPRNGVPNLNPHGKPPRDLFLSQIKLGAWWLDYTIGYLMNVFPKLATSTLVLFDRYYYDLTVDPKRYRYRGPLWLTKLVGKFIPSPNLVILLLAPMEVLYARKQEVHPEVIELQRSAYLQFINSMPNGFVVDASKPLDKVLAQTEKIILDFMEKRITQRFSNLKGKLN